jgi:quinol monooxygenase YgiN
VEFVIGWFWLKPGDRDEFMAVARPTIAITQTEDGCIFYEFHPSTLDPNLVVVIEGWQSPGHLKAHKKAPHHLAFASELGRLAVEGRFEEIEADKVVTRRPKW